MKSIKGGKHPQKDADMPGMLSRVLKNEATPSADSDASTKMYAELLVSLIKPYHKPEPTLEEAEFLLDLGMAAWNMAVMKQKDKHVYKLYREGVLSDPELDKDSKQLVDKLIKDKEKNFAAHDKMMQDFEIIDHEEQGGVTVEVVAASYEDFLKNILFGEEDDDDDDEIIRAANGDQAVSLPLYVNRSAIGVTPKQPFSDWLQQIPYSDKKPLDIAEDNAVYLIPTLDEKKDRDQWLMENFDQIFQSELEGWHTDESAWPKNRTFSLFMEWFDVKGFSYVHDLDPTALTRI
jgi:hypothetical protein